jgi:hypothetical protein
MRLLSFVILLVPVGLSAAACAPGYTSTDVVYAQPADHVYVVPMDRVIVVSRDVLVRRGWTVFKVERRGPDRIIWARRGEDEIVRIFATPDHDQVVIRGLHEARDPRRRVWVRRNFAEDVVADIDVRLRAR